MIGRPGILASLFGVACRSDRRGGNVLFAGPPAVPIAGQDLRGAQGMPPTRGLGERPLGPG